jgi:transportin-3
LSFHIKITIFPSHLYHLQSLRNSLLDHVDILSQSSFITVQTQIYIALSDLIMLMSSWENPVPEIIERFTKPPDRMAALIEFLTILPEEINNKRLKLGQNRRDQLKTLFTNSSTCIIQFLESTLKVYLSNPDQDTYKQNKKVRQIYKCFSTWIEEKLIEPSLIMASNLFPYAFNLLCQPDTDVVLHEVLTTCVVNMLLMFPFNTRVTGDLKTLLVGLKTSIIGLVNAYKNAEAQTDVDKCSDLVLIFTELCNAISYYLIAEPHSNDLGDLNTLHLLLMSGTHKEYEVFHKTFIFWFNISEEIYTNPASEKLCLQFRPFIYQLVDHICIHCRLEADHTNVAPLKNEEFGEFRLKASELVADVIFIVEAHKCFEKMYGTLHSANTTWFELEATLFVMCAFSKSISPDEEQSVIEVVHSILNLPEQVHIAVRCTGIKLIGELCDWINKHPQFLDAALNFVCLGFNSPDMCQVAANTMLNICTKCQQHLLNHLETLINIVLTSDSAGMPNEASLELLKGAVVILCNLPAGEVTVPLMKLCSVQLVGLQKALQQTGKSKEPVLSPLYWLDRFSAIFRTIKIRNYVDGIHPCKPVIEAVWPTLSHCLTKYQDNAKISESCCRSLRFALRCTEKHSCGVLADVAQNIVAKYSHSHFSCYLYLGSILVDIYGTDDVVKTGLIDMMQAFTQEAFDFIVKSCKTVENISELRKHPDTIDDFFRLALRFIQRCPYEFINSAIFSPIMTLAVTSLSLDHRDANLSVTKFLSEFVGYSHKPQITNLAESNHTVISRVLDEIGEKLIENTVNATINMTTRDTKEGIADLICELLGVNRKQVDHNLKVVLSNLKNSSMQGGEMVTERQLGDVHGKIMDSNSSIGVENALIQLEQLYL